jgi:GntR family transcriptional regulator
MIDTSAEGRSNLSPVTSTRPRARKRSDSGLERSSPLPLYHQIARLLIDRIAERVYPENSLMPSEDELHREFEVSRGTIREALRELRDAGLVERQQGVGTFVRTGASAALGQRFRGSLADLLNETRRIRVNGVRLVRETPTPVNVAQRLGIADDLVTRVERTQIFDGQAFAYTVNWLPQQFGSLLDEKSLRSASLMALLMERGVPLFGAEQSIRAQSAGADVSHRLDIAIGDPVLFVERLVTTADQQPVELVHTWYRGDLYEYTVTFDLRAREDLQDLYHLA